MWRRNLKLIVILAIVGLCALPAFGQRRGGGPGRGPGRGPGFGPGRAGWGPDGPRALTVEERQEMYDRVAEYRLERFTEDYELTPDQQELVRTRLDMLKEEQWAYSEPYQDEMLELRKEMYQAMRSRRERGEEGRERMRSAWERMREIREDAPLMSEERAAEAIEWMLPSDQVEKGQQRRAEREAERERRRAEFRERGGRRGPRDGERGPGGRDRGFRGDRWDRYVEDFIERYQLDAAQTATAQSVLRELKQQRDAYRQKNQAQFDTLGQIEDRRARREAFEKLNAPTDALYEQLQQRLARIPTNAQRAAAEAAAAQAQLDRATSRPAGPRSRPAGEPPRRGRSERGQ